jgi:LysR family transcriptional activator of the allD operon
MDPRLPNLDFETIRTFAVVAHLRSFSAAAARLHRTTSAVSYRIKSLEDGIGTPLFVRTTRTVTLTPAGKVLLEKANQLFEWLQDLPEELRQVGEDIEPHFTLVINNLLYEPNAVASLLSHLYQAFPHTEFEVRYAVYMGVWEEMLHNGGHLAIGAPGFHTIDNDFDTRPLGIINWAFVVPPDHPLAKTPGPLTNDDVRRFPAINVQDTSHRLIKRVAWKLSGQKEMLVPDMRAKLACHLQGFGVGFLPTTMVGELLQKRKLVQRTLVQERSPSPLSLVWRRQSAGKVCKHLRDLCVSSAPLVSPLLAPMDAFAVRSEFESLKREVLSSVTAG